MKDRIDLMPIAKTPYFLIIEKISVLYVGECRISLSIKQHQSANRTIMSYRSDYHSSLGQKSLDEVGGQETVTSSYQYSFTEPKISASLDLLSSHSHF